MCDSEDIHWFDQEPITFERRIPEIMVPEMEKHGFGERKADLVVLGSLFWDEKFIYEVRYWFHRGLPSLLLSLE